MHWSISRLIGFSNLFSIVVILLFSIAGYSGSRYLLLTFNELNQFTNSTTNIVKLQSQTLDLTHSEQSYLLSKQVTDYKKWKEILISLNSTVELIESHLINQQQQDTLDDFILAQLEYENAFEQIHLFLREGEGEGEGEDVILAYESLAREKENVSLRKSMILSKVMVDATIDLVRLNEINILESTEKTTENISRASSFMLIVFMLGAGIISFIGYRTYISAKIISENLANTTVSRDMFKEAKDQAENSEKIATLRTIEIEEKNVKLAAQGEELNRTNKELITTQEQLIQSAKLASIGEFSAGLAHELNQPLGVIQISAQFARELIERDYFEKEIVTNKLKRIVGQVERASKIINHLKIFSRKEEPDAEDVDINWVIDEALVLHNESLHIKGIKLTTELAKNLPPVSCNYIQIEQVLSNLLTNARDALESTKEKLICVRSYKKSEVICVDVEDTGCGMSTSVTEKVFDPFFTTKPVGKGTGLGMSISYGIMKDHNGKLAIVSREGHGTCFTLSLPMTG